MAVTSVALFFISFSIGDIVLLLLTGVVVHILRLNVLFRLSGHLQENPQVERVTWLEKEATIYVLDRIHNHFRS